MKLQVGNFKAKALEIEFGKSKNGTEQVAVSFQLLEGPNQGTIISWYGYFTEATTDRTLQSLMYTGWDGESLERGKMKGFGTKDVRIVLGEEEYEGEKKVKVQWVNEEFGTAPMLKEKMNDGDQLAFANRFKGRALALKQKRAEGKKDDKEPWDGQEDVPFDPKK